jgi:hypothetical protein
MSADSVRHLLGKTPPALVHSERVMLFRPRGQALTLPEEDGVRLPSMETPTQHASGLPVVALLDGLPMQNHPLLAGHVSVDDPDKWESTYQARDRVHGTAMASLILYGELDGPKALLSRPIYARPIMRSDPADLNVPRKESTPDDVLLIDLVHRSFRRMFEGDGDVPATAPSIKIVNLSVGDAYRPFDGDLSPWARLLDWLSSKYRVLIVVSAGNVPAQLSMSVSRETLSTLSNENRQQLALSALVSESILRRLLTPAESINAITVGSVHSDGSKYVQASDRYDLFPDRGVSPYSSIGYGFKRAIKPDILLPGGRILHRAPLTGASSRTELQIINGSAGPGHRVATPPDDSGQDTKYARGTSNSTALATRGAAQAHAVIEVLRAENPEKLPERFDAVLLKALLVHGAQWGELEGQIVNSRPDIDDWRQRKNLVTRFVGYGLADIDRAITCTERRATLLGVGELMDGRALEFRVPLPPSLNAQVVKRRLTITLAWISPVNSRHAKYRAARLWIKPPHEELGVDRLDCDWQAVQRGTVQHEILEGTNATPFVDGDSLLFKVNCAEDGDKLPTPVPFALCVTLEVAEGVDLPIYQEIRERVTTKVSISG